MRKLISICIFLLFLSAVYAQTVSKIAGVDDPAKINSVEVNSISSLSGTSVETTCKSCKEILEKYPGSTDGIYTIDPDGSGTAEEFDCYCDMTTDGGGWTLVTIHSDDGQSTWNFNNRDLFYNSSTIGNVDELNKDYKGRAMTELNFTDILFIHAPSQIWAAYHSVGDGTASLGNHITTIPFPNCPSGPGYSLSDGTLSTSGSSLCSTDLYFNVGDHDGTGYAYCQNLGEKFNNATYGPAWSAGNNSGCPFDDPGTCSSLGPDVQSPATENLPIGFGQAINKNTGTAGSGENHMKVFIR